MAAFYFDTKGEEDACLKLFGTGMDAGGTTLSTPTVPICCETVPKAMDGCCRFSPTGPACAVLGIGVSSLEKVKCYPRCQQSVVALN